MKRGYRRFDKYLETLSESCRQNVGKNICICIYFDKSTADIKNKFMKFENVELIEYDFEQFRDGGFHKGVFGTLIRFLQLMNFGNRNWISCFDADMILDYDEIRECSKAMAHFKADYYTMMSDMNDAQNTRHCGSKVLDTVTMATLIARNNISIDPRIIIQFLKDILSQDKKIVSWNTAIKKDNQRRSFEENLLSYGIDEFFINTYVLPEIHKRHKILGVRLYLNLLDCNYELLNTEGLRPPSSFVKKAIQIFAGTGSKKNMTAEEILKHIDTFLFTGKSLFVSLNKDICIYRNYLKLISEIKWHQFNKKNTDYLNQERSTKYHEFNGRRIYVVFVPKKSKG
jgi:hypothetical protein